MAELRRTKQGLAYRLWGEPSRPPLLLLHGFLGSAQEWRSWRARLSQHWYCLCVDLPGHGQSDHLYLPEQRGFSLLDDALVQLMRSLSNEPWAIWGYSLGGRIALYHAVKRNVPLRWLLLESCNPGLACESERRARRSADERWARRLELEPIEQVLEDWYRQPVFSDLSARARKQLVTLRKANNPRALAAMLRSTSLGRQPPLLEHLYSLTCPWRYLAGAKDVKFARIAQELPVACQQRLPDAGHNIHRERPEALWSALEAFLSSAGLVKELQ